MKKAAIIVVCFLTLLLLCGCQAKEQDNMEITSNKTLTLMNELKDADVWILPDTEKNHKTTAWGTATVSNVKTGESRQAPLCEPGDDGLYLFRMIDTDGFFYSADGIALEADWTVQIKGNDLRSVTMEVMDENGVSKNTYHVFAARL